MVIVRENNQICKNDSLLRQIMKTRQGGASVFPFCCTEAKVSPLSRSRSVTPEEESLKRMACSSSRVHRPTRATAAPHRCAVEEQLRC